MKILNITRKTVLAEDAKEARSLLDRSLGLLRKSNPRAIILKTRWGVHTFGMREPIDVLILDDNNHIKDLTEDMRPWKMFFWNPQHCTVIELPAGTVKRTKTQIGDSVEFRLLFSSK